MKEKYGVDHVLKLRGDFWHPVMRREKTFEVRLNDRGFQKGDIICFDHVDKCGVPIGEQSKRYKIDYVLNGWGIKDEYVVFSFSEFGD